MSIGSVPIGGDPIGPVADEVEIIAPAAGPHYFAWTAADEAFDPEVHNRADEKVFSIRITQTEGDFATAAVEVRNPRVGLLGAGRNFWAWLSWFDGADIVPIFRGRLVGVPEQLHNELVLLTFVARPADFEEQKLALAETLRVAPYWDPVWLVDKIDEPDTVLEARSQLWHIDRLTLEVSVSDITAGEAGVIEVTEGEHFYEDMDVSFGQSPLRRVSVTGTVTWDQTGAGEVDFSKPLWQAFKDTGSPLPFPLIASLTGNGLVASWPPPGQTIGGGWEIGPNSTITPAAWLQQMSYRVTYADVEEPTEKATATTPTELAKILVRPSTNWVVIFDAGVYSEHFTAAYRATRKRTETVSFSLEADVQPLLVDPGAAETATIALNSEYVGQPIEPDGSLPIGDISRPSYFKLARGQQSFQYLLALARARLLANARAVLIKFAIPWSTGLGFTCRHNGKLFDGRLPGGNATGKVSAYSLIMDESGVRAEITLACTIGYGGSATASDGTPSYAEDGYMELGYQLYEGQEFDLFADSITYQSFDEFVLVDDGVNLQNMQAEDLVQSIVVEGALDAQLAIITSGRGEDALEHLRDLPTVITVNLVPVNGGAFLTEFLPAVSDLKIPKTIDLEAA